MSQTSHIAPMTPVAPLVATPMPTGFQFDEGAFLKKIPFPINRTTQPGVYSIPAPPDSFDPLHASQSDLTRNGFLFR